MGQLISSLLTVRSTCGYPLAHSPEIIVEPAPDLMERNKRAVRKPSDQCATTERHMVLPDAAPLTAGSA